MDILNNTYISKNKGFTLIELLVVVAIVSLLSTIIFASLDSARGKARDAKRFQDIQQINTAIALYQSDHNGLPPDLGNPSCADISTYDPSCFASTGQGLANWEILATQLQPYLAVLPSDPCPSCTASVTLISKAYAQSNPDFEYVYQAPAAVNAYLTDQGIDPSEASASGQVFSIYASQLEEKSGVFGFGFRLPTGSVCPYAIDACTMWTQCNEGDENSCNELANLLEKCNGGDSESCKRLGIEPSKK